MPGKTITDHQVHKYKQHRNKLTQVVAAAGAGISERSARRIEGAQSLPSQRPARDWRTRQDPLQSLCPAKHSDKPRSLPCKALTAAVAI